MKSFSMLAIILCAACIAQADSTVNVTPSNKNGWTLNVFDNNGAIANPLEVPYINGTAELVSGPGTPPGGAGAAHLATAPYGGDGAAAVATEQFDGTKLSAITSLSYATYDVSNNGQQFPYLAISINTGSIDNTGSGNTNVLDTLFFEPPYQTPSTGNPALADQGATAMNQWQTWNPSVGGFWDNLGVGNPGVGSPGVVPLSTFVADFPNAEIENGGFTGLGGIALQVGFASSTDNFEGYVANFDIGVGGTTTDFEFGPNTSSTPLPASVWEGLALFLIAGVVMAAKRRRAA